MASGAGKSTVILRPIPDTNYYQLIGECYVHGAMQGELVGSIDFFKIGLA